MRLKDPCFLTKAQVLLYHEEQIRIFGGSAGLRDDNLLESAIAAPQNVYRYQDNADIFDLAASYLKSLAKNHPFIDGNKRAATDAAISFLKINGWELDMEPAYLTLLVESLITGSCDEMYVADFLFIACCLKLRELYDWESLAGNPPESFLKAPTEEERKAILVDFITAAFRVRLIELSSRLMIRPSRFDSILDRLENHIFQKVERKWREQFGMNCDDE